MLTVENIAKSFAPGVRVLNDVSTQMNDGEVACLLGPSGCGKTTLLRIIAGLETPDSGRVLFNGEDLVGQPVYLRRFGYMFQDYALFPHMNVAANIAFGLRMAGWNAGRRQRRVDEMLALVNLVGYQRRSVDELSGGEQQRVALARTLAPSPRLLLLDEPLANLDRLLREELVDELRGILKQVEVTTIFVTHDQAEAFALADHVVVMRAGRVEQEGAPQEVYRLPANIFVASFLGFHNLLPGTVADDGLSAETVLGRLPLAAPQPSALQPPAPPSPALAAPAYCVLIRPDAALLTWTAGAAPLVELAGQVVAASFRGGVYRIQFAPENPGAPILQFDLATHNERLWPQAGQHIRLALDPVGILLVRANGAAAALAG